MTHGKKGCYLYCADQETAQYFKTGLPSTVQTDGPADQMSLFGILPDEKTVSSTRKKAGQMPCKNHKNVGDQMGDRSVF